MQGGASFCREPVEASRVERVPRQIERVAPAACRDSFLAQRTSQARDVDLQVVASRDALATPDVLEELVGRHRVPLGQGKVDQERARTRAPDVDGSAVVVEHLERSQDPDLHVPPRAAGVSATRKPAYRCPDEARGMHTDDHLSAHDLAALAWEAHTRHQVAEAVRLASRASGAAVACPRRIRQEVEVVCLAVVGESARAYGLASDHLGEFPHDDLVRWVKDASE